MPGDIALICGNWGNTNLRAFAMDQSGAVVSDFRTGPGVLGLSAIEQAEVWFELTASWTAVAPNARHLLCGAVGSNIGWLETGYLSCPSPLAILGKAVSWRTVRNIEIGIVPGLAATTPFGEPDRLRGEEMELLGWLTKARVDRAIVCLPGTHSKWVKFEEGEVQGFMTGFAGELFSLLEAHSILVGQTPQSINEMEFMAGLDLGFAAHTDLMHSLFSVRSRQISGELHAEHARSFLSGLITAADISGALGQFEQGSHELTIIASPTLGEAYRLGFERRGVSVQVTDSLEASVLGFSALQSQGI